ncbi:glycoside hydrolase family 127 protein [Aquibacillus albus]|uniref:DUF1680 family protein n=1 Tax=Aquibacillus albus TaxID=1168171 RepID=A0ABS2N3L8_9BACI|nr:beta-L-arabinofuranosidase domain-containing protein [Aquibacillus albus]MBM7572717.1 DUF1680 family protein [Aquibacillus albus]
MKDLNEKIVNNQLEPISFTNVTIHDKFWEPRLKTHKSTTLKACLDQCEKTGRILNFAKAAGHMQGEFEGIFFNDSDVYKVLEGVAYSLMSHPDPSLEEKVDGIIDEIASAQQEDGYLLCYFILKEQDKKWTDMDKHEMYCGGHLIEAAVAYYNATGKRKLLDVACKLADHYDNTFGPGKRHWVPGHEEIELALVKLYRQTKEERYWKLANWLLEQRGHGYGKGVIWDRKDWGPEYCQDDKPIREMTDVSGHAVRAMYLYTAITDIAKVTGDQGYINALDRLWESVVLRNMYITGGIGPSKHNEGFTEDYDMPNDTAYCETCASVGMVYWNHRMNLLNGDSKYADVVERAMYNGVLSGISLSGDKFFYVNPLSSNGTHHRVEWFNTSCCPTQLSRFIPSIGDYSYASSEQGIWVNLYVESSVSIPVEESHVVLRQKTHYPWNGKVEITVESDRKNNCDLNLRFPGWCKSAQVYINGEPVQKLVTEKGYIKLNKTWEPGDTVIVNFDMPVERVHAHPKVKANEGKVAIQRGPLVYCIEHVDNEKKFESIEITPDTKFLVKQNPDLLGGITTIHGISEKDKEFVAIPYYVWDNREPGPMNVWINENKN